MRLWRPRKCSTTRDVIRIFTLETNARPNAEGSTVNTSVAFHEKPTKGGSEAGSKPNLLFVHAEQAGDQNRQAYADERRGQPRRNAGCHGGGQDDGDTQDQRKQRASLRRDPGTATN